MMIFVSTLQPCPAGMTTFSFAGVSIPSAGRAGWFYGTDRWKEGEFFRSEIISYSLVAEPR